VLEGIKRYSRCGFVITSRLIGFDQEQWFDWIGAKTYLRLRSILAEVGIDKKTIKRQQIKNSPLSSKEIRASKKLYEQQWYRRFESGRYKSKSEFSHIESSYEYILPKGWSGFSSFFERSELPVFYLVPFNKAQTHQFIDNWYRQYLGQDNGLSQRIANLQQCLINHDALEHLARTPVLLNMICFIHSRRGRLPDGRAELYQRIAETYLTNLDRARGINKFRDREFNYDYLDLSEWLGKLALKLQDKRNEHDQSLLIDQKQVKTLLIDELINRGMPQQQSEEEVEDILAYIAQRSGLFIPRGQNSEYEEQYGFAHLSFLEYFAAFALKQEAQIDTTCLTDRYFTINLPWWHECWALFFEQLEHSRLTEKYLTELFKSPLNPVKSGSLKHALLLAKIVMDSSVRLGIQIRQSKIKELSTYYLENSWSQLFSEGEEEATAFCELIWSERFDSRRIFAEHAKVIGATSFALTGSAINDLSPLAALFQLKQLNLGNTGICDLSLLSGLSQLELLSVEHTSIRDLTPLTGLKQLSFLNLSDTAISDLSPLAQLKKLSTLVLNNTAISDLSPLAELKGLTHLVLTNTGIRDFLPLTGLDQLRGLYLSNTTISDLAPLATLSQLTELFLNSTATNDLSPLAKFGQLSRLSLNNTAIHDLSPLAGLSQLKILYLGSTSITDLSPLAGLSQLKILYLGSTSITDLSPLAGLSQLFDLDLSRTTISDLTPLAKLNNLKSLHLPNRNIKGINFFKSKKVNLFFDN
jgi:internalin A